MSARLGAVRPASGSNRDSRPGPANPPGDRLGRDRAGGRGRRTIRVLRSPVGSPPLVGGHGRRTGGVVVPAAQTRAILDGTSQGKTTVRSRRAALLAGAFVLLAALNVLATRYNLRWDLTTNDVHALSDQTQDILRRLDTRVRVRVFGRQEDLSGYRDRPDRVREGFLECHGRLRGRRRAP